MKKLFKKDVNSSNLKEHALKLLNKEGFYVAIFLCITLVATLVVYYANNNFERDIVSEDQIAEETTEIDQGKPDNVNQPILEEEEEAEETQAPVAETEEEETQEEEVVEEVQEDTGPTSLENFVNPVSSQEIVMAFSLGGAPVFSKTLNEFTSDHAGVDIEAEIGEEVKAALDGKVIKIYNDVKLGQTVVIEHSNNMETRYSNLEEKVSVTLNQAVKAGDVIGKVGETSPFESEEPPHLHFEVWKDGKNVDPSEYIK